MVKMGRLNYNHPANDYLGLVLEEESPTLGRFVDRLRYHNIPDEDIAKLLNFDDDDLIEMENDSRVNGNVFELDKDYWNSVSRYFTEEYGDSFGSSLPVQNSSFLSEYNKDSYWGKLVGLARGVAKAHEVMGGLEKELSEHRDKEIELI